MSNEFDYSGLYNHTPQDKPQQDTASAAPEAGGETPPQTGYPNVGSSGMNTANTARTCSSVGAGLGSGSLGAGLLN